MPIIAPHCRAQPQHLLACDWPEEAYVQWGVAARDFADTRGAETTAFFEVFPHGTETFIRAEGTTIETAEYAAHKKFKRQSACAEHTFVRGRYTNGAGVCGHCGMFKPDAFEELPR